MFSNIHFRFDSWKFETLLMPRVFLPPLLGFSYILHLHSLQMFQENTAKKEISEGPNGLIPAEGI